MLRILGSNKTLCNGRSRRELLLAGGLGLLGLGLGDRSLLGQSAAAAPRRPAKPGFGRAKSCILLYLFGAASQLELCDMKPDAPVEIRGELKPIRSRLPGCDVCELLPNMARIMDRVTVVRSVSHPYPAHCVHYTMTGNPKFEFPLLLDPGNPRHWPYLGSVIDRLTPPGRGDTKTPGLPQHVGLPFPFNSQVHGPRYAGFSAGFLGNAHAPVWGRFRGRATGSVTRSGVDDLPGYTGPEPFLGIGPDDPFAIGEHAGLEGGITLDRLRQRRSLLDQLDHARREMDEGLAARAFTDRQAQAFTLIGAEKVRTALDLRKEPRSLRESYGMNLFGQSTLLARRLVEAGTRFVTVVWDMVGSLGTAWDTHIDHFPRMKNELLPGLDRAFATLIQDLEARGLLDETLVLCLSEHGRTPQLFNVKGGGRGHWSEAYTNLFAGGGIARGRVVGQTDRIGASVRERPVSPKDILATAYHLLGIDPQTTLTDRAGRPVPLAADGQVVHELLA